MLGKSETLAIGGEASREKSLPKKARIFAASNWPTTSHASLLKRLRDRKLRPKLLNKHGAKSTWYHTHAASRDLGQEKQVLLRQGMNEDEDFIGFITRG